MNVLELAKDRGLQPKKVASTKGGEWKSPCPGCGGRDRFMIWPETKDGTGSYNCRQCGKHGDNIQFIIDFEGLSYPKACARLDIEVKKKDKYATPRPPTRESDSAIADPEGRILPDVPEGVKDIELWREKAGKLVSWAHEQLLEEKSVRRWLLKRGIKKKSIVKFKLGWNPGRDGKDLWRPRESWGLETIFKKNKQKKKLWIPRGLVIPKLNGDEVERIRIRRQEGEPRYFVILGSSMATLAIRADNRAVVVVESELDAILLEGEVSDMAGVVALGSSSTRPDKDVVTRLNKVSVILLALDYDQAGLKACEWWKESFPQVVRWPVPKGGDPGEAYQAGVDLKKWIVAGLPSGWRIGQSLLGSIKKGGELLNESRPDQNNADKSRPDTPIKKDRAIYSLSGGRGDNHTLEVPRKVRGLAEYLKKYPVSIHVSPERVFVRESPAWSKKNWELSKKISNLVFMTPEVFDYLCGHPDQVIDGKNIIK